MKTKVSIERSIVDEDGEQSEDIEHVELEILLEEIFLLPQSKLT